MNVTLSEVFEYEKSQLDIFKAHDLDRFIERTRNGNPIGFASRVGVVGFTIDLEAVGIARNGEASCQFVWKGDDVTFVRAWYSPDVPEEMPEWLQTLGGGL